MSAKFNGFTEEDINKITNKNVKINAHPRIGRKLTPTITTATTTTAATNDNKKVPPISSSTATTTTSKTINSQMSSKPINKIEKDFQNISLDAETIQSIQDAMQFKPLPQPPPQSKHQSSASPKRSTEIAPTHLLQENITYTDVTTDSTVDNSINDVKSSPFKGVSLKDFEEQRRLVEEQNKQRKDMLYKAIAQHSERTAAEAKKLQEIKIELSKLDSELAADVAILRKQIELASVQFMNSQKKFHQIENQYLNAKLELHQAGEKKELLTEHLCTIISHNEERKAKKLIELMEKVGMSTVSPTLSQHDNDQTINEQQQPLDTLPQSPTSSSPKHHNTTISVSSDVLPTSFYYLP